MFLISSSIFLKIRVLSATNSGVRDLIELPKTSAFSFAISLTKEFQFLSKLEIGSVLFFSSDVVMVVSFCFVRIVRVSLE